MLRLGPHTLRLGKEGEGFKLAMIALESGGRVEWDDGASGVSGNPAAVTVPLSPASKPNGNLTPPDQPSVKLS